MPKSSRNSTSATARPKAEVHVIPPFDVLRAAAKSFYGNSKETPAQKAHKTAKWARIMTKWLISHSSRGGVKWQVVSFNGKSGQESKGIVDMIAIRKNHKPKNIEVPVGDLFEIILIQVKGGSAALPSKEDLARLEAVRAFHNADKVVLTEWKKGQALNCYVIPDMKNSVSAASIFGTVPSVKQVQKASIKAETEVPESGAAV